MISRNSDVMLPPDENAVVSAVCEHLMSSGYQIIHRSTTTEHGIDVIAEHPETKVRVLVEAKGGTSSREGSERFGKPYTQTQVLDRVAKGIYTCLKYRTANPDKKTVRVILALPNSPRSFQEYVNQVLLSLVQAGIEVWYTKDIGDESTR